VSNPFSWDYLTASVNEMAVWGPFSIAYALVFALGLFVAVYLNWDSHSRLKDRPLLYRTVQRGTWIAIVVFGIGLFFLLIRILQVSALNLHWRLWMYLSVLAAVLMFAYFWYYARTVYPRLVAAEEADARKREYIERPAHGGGGRRRRSRGKKKKKA
jgi:hypothetical protein